MEWKVSDPKIIIPLDYPDQEQALNLVKKIDPLRCRLKVGKELFTSAGPVLVENLVARGFDVFLDLKFHDIPTTTAKACCASASLGVWMVNVHATGGQRMLAMVREEIDKQQHKPLLIAVTVLTSLNDEDLVAIGINYSVTEQVINLARLAKENGLDGVVCSAQEVETLRNEFGEDFCLVTPGIRPQGTEQNDQSRTMTPIQAINAGSDYLVIGRPITQALDPLQALIAIEKEIESVASKM